MITVPASQPMVALLGTSDEYLRLIEAAFGDADGGRLTIIYLWCEGRKRDAYEHT
jgi:hypothetical protein